MTQEAEHPSVIDGVEERPYVRVQDPVRPPFDGHGEGVQGVVLRPTGSEAVRESQELRLVNRLHEHPHRLLDDLVLQRRDAQRPHLAIPLGDEDPAHGQRLVAPAVKAVLKSSELLLQVLAVLRPRRTIDTCRGPSLETLVRLPQQRHRQVAEQVVEPFLLVRLRAFAHPVQMHVDVLPALCRGRSGCPRFSLGHAPSLHRLDGRYPRLRRLLAGRYYERVRLLDAYPSGLRLLAFPLVPPLRWASIEVSRFPCMRHVRACRGLRPRGDRDGVFHTLPPGMAFRVG